MSVEDTFSCAGTWIPFRFDCSRLSSDLQGKFQVSLGDKGRSTVILVCMGELCCGWTRLSCNLCCYLSVNGCIWTRPCCVYVSHGGSQIGAD